jgi:hypothetical protein
MLRVARSCRLARAARRAGPRWRGHRRSPSGRSRSPSAALGRWVRRWRACRFSIGLGVDVATRRPQTLDPASAGSRVTDMRTGGSTRAAGGDRARGFLRYWVRRKQRVKRWARVCALAWPMTSGICRCGAPRCDLARRQAHLPGQHARCTTWTPTPTPCRLAATGRRRAPSRSVAATPRNCSTTRLTRGAVGGTDVRSAWRTATGCGPDPCTIRLSFTPGPFAGSCRPGIRRPAVPPPVRRTSSTRTRTARTEGAARTTVMPSCASGHTVCTLIPRVTTRRAQTPT